MIELYISVLVDPEKSGSYLLPKDNAKIQATAQTSEAFHVSGEEPPQTISGDWNFDTGGSFGIESVWVDRACLNEQSLIIFDSGSKLKFEI